MRLCRHTYTHAYTQKHTKDRNLKGEIYVHTLQILRRKRMTTAVKKTSTLCDSWFHVLILLAIARSNIISECVLWVSDLSKIDDFPQCEWILSSPSRGWTEQKGRRIYLFLSSCLTVWVETSHVILLSPALALGFTLLPLCF